MVKRSRPQWHLAATVLLMAGVVIAVIGFSWHQIRMSEIALLAPLASPTQVYAAGGGDSLIARVDSALAELGVWSELISKTVGDSAGAVARIDVRVPSDLPLPEVNRALSELVLDSGGRVFHAREAGPRRVTMECGFDSVRTTIFELRQERHLRRRAGLIAVVLDDFGRASWGQYLAERFCSLPQQLTLAVLPNEGPASAITELATRHGHEVLLHLPMEPLDPAVDPGSGAIRVGQAADTIRHLVAAALQRVPAAVGVNNHMGSRATADFRVMDEVLRELAGRQLFFLDSRTSAESLAVALASALEVPVAERDLFIDAAEDGVRDVEEKLWQLATLASERGQAIGIGHDREATLLALESVLPRLESRGFRFVAVSQLVQ